MTDVNLHDLETEREAGRPAAYDRGAKAVGPLLGATALGLTVYDLAAGQSICPYHYEHGCEEWLFVLAGSPTLRDPEGEHELAPGDVVLFPEGEEGAHKVTNGGGGVARVAVLSNKDLPAVVVYPDSAEVGFWPGGRLFRLGDEVGYFDGET